MNTAKVHVKTNPPLANNSSLAKSEPSDNVRRQILVAEQLRETMLMACAGELSNIEPARAQAFIDATVDLYGALDEVRKGVVARNNRSDQLDMLLVIFALSKLEKHVELALGQASLGKRNA